MIEYQKILDKNMKEHARGLSSFSSSEILKITSKLFLLINTILLVNFIHPTQIKSSIDITLFQILNCI